MQFKKKILPFCLALTIGGYAPLAIAEGGFKIISSKNNSDVVEAKVISTKTNNSIKTNDLVVERSISDSEYEQKVKKVSTKKKNKAKQTKSKSNAKQKISKNEYVDGKFVGTILNGFANNISYNEAINQIVPGAWKINIDPQIQEILNGTTSWTGGTYWTEVLRDSFSNSGIAIIVDPYNKEVSFQSELAYQANSQGFKYQIFPSDRTLRAAFARWAHQSGYQFVWDVPRDIPNSGMYFASKKDLEGALDEIISAINQDGDLNIAAYIHETEGQKVLRITKHLQEAAK